MAHCEDLADLLDTLLGGLGDLLRIDHAMLWLFDASQQVLTLLASRGYAVDGAGAEISMGEGLVGTAVREGVPIRVGHMMNMATYARAVRDSAGESGLTAVLENEIPLPGLKEPRSQLAVPLRARGRVLGALFVESLHDQYFGYDDEDALMLLVRPVRRGDESHAAAGTGIARADCREALRGAGRRRPGTASQAVRPRQQRIPR